jgi:hypothetical protein
MRRFGLLGFLALGLLLNGGAARAADVDMALVLAVGHRQLDDRG